MDIQIQLADLKYIDSCIEILQNSDLGKAYFSDHEKAVNMLTYAVGQENVYVAVKEEYRNYGVGKQLIRFLRIMLPMLLQQSTF